MTPNEILRRFPAASRSFIAANVSAGDAGPVAVVEPNPGNASLGAQKVQGQAGARFLVRVESIRKRLIDEDNLCEKYHVDLCRYAGVLPDDAPGQTQIEVCQRKVGKGEAERTVIEVYDNRTI